MKGSTREFLIKWKGFDEASWESESNPTLRPIIEHHFSMINGTYDCYPSVLALRPASSPEVAFEMGKVVVTFQGQKIKNYDELLPDAKKQVLEELETLFYLSCDL